MINLNPKPQLPKGMNDLLEFLQFLNNKKEVEKHLEDLKKYTQEAEKASALVGKASEIESLHASALKKDQEATKFLNGVEEKAAQILLEAQTEAGRTLETAKSEISVMVSETKNKNEASLKRERASKEKEKDLKKLEVQLQSANQAQQAREIALSKREQEVERKEKVLAQL